MKIRGSQSHCVNEYWFSKVGSPERTSAIEYHLLTRRVIKAWPWLVDSGSDCSFAFLFAEASDLQCGHL